MAPSVNSSISLILTFTTLGMGYSSLYFGYYLADRLVDFKENVRGTDKIMQSFVIGTVMLLYALLTSDISGFKQPSMADLFDILPEYFFVWISSSFFIMLILIIHREQK